VFLDDTVGDLELASVQAMILRQVNYWLNPELGFPARALHMDVEPGFLAGEKVKPEAAVAEDGGAHGA